MLGLEEIRRMDSVTGRFTLIFLAAPGDRAWAEAERAPLLELTYNWDKEDYGSAKPINTYKLIRGSPA